MVATNQLISNVVTAISSGACDTPTHIGIGTDSTPPDESDTALGNELQRNAIETTTTTDTTIIFTTLINSAEQVGQTLKEFGLFDASTSGDMFQRTTHTTISKTGRVEVEYEITIRVTN